MSPSAKSVFSSFVLDAEGATLQTESHERTNMRKNVRFSLTWHLPVEVGGGGLASVEGYCPRIFFPGDVAGHLGQLLWAVSLRGGVRNADPLLPTLSLRILTVLMRGGWWTCRSTPARRKATHGLPFENQVMMEALTFAWRRRWMKCSNARRGARLV